MSKPSVTEQIRQIQFVLEKEFKRVQDEIERGCSKGQFDVFDDLVSEVFSSHQKIDKVLEGCVVVDKQKLQELADLLKNRPRHVRGQVGVHASYWVASNGRKMSYEEIDAYLEKLEMFVRAKFVELTEDEKQQ